MEESVYNFHKYEKYLSPFGQKVLTNLYKLKTQNCARSINSNVPNYSQRFRPERKKVLTFEDSTRAHLLHDKTNFQFDDDIEFEYEQIRSKPSVSTSNDLLMPINNVVNNQREEVNDILVDDKVSQLLIKEICNIENVTYNNVSKENLDLISWDNIFDSDLLDDLEGTNPNKNQEDKKNADYDLGVNITYKNPDVTETTEIITPNIVIESKINPQCYKRKIDSSNKLQKIIKDDGVSFRKEKYTKTVKQWLNNVNANNALENENEICSNIQSHEILPLRVAHTKLNNKLVNKQKHNKKTVQARLANKDGIMKFAKPQPTNNTSEIIYTEDSIIDSNIVIMDSKREAKVDKVKEKKVKSKFIAPIKTPLPLRDIVYTVHILNNDNIKEFEEQLSTNTGDVAMVLVYSNGFSQLNKQYTTDVCVPEGVMFLKDETYYYVKIFQEDFAELLRKLMQNVLIGYDAKEVLTYLMSRADLSCCKFNILDLKIGGSLMRPDEPPETFSSLQKLLSYSPGFTIATDSGLQKAAWYMSLMVELYPKLRDYLIDKDLWKVFVDLEMRVLPIIAGMEQRGIQVDLDKLKSMDNSLVARMREVEAECYRAAGKTFQINSALQVRNLLYEELNLDAKCNIKIRETICKAKSTSEATLRALAPAHALPGLVLQYRRLHKAHATFVAGILVQVRGGVVKPTWDQMAAVTGRVACNNPNLQAIPKAPFSLFLNPNDDQTGRAALLFRASFGPRAGRELLAADFRHVECRVFAHAAADAALARALARPDLFAVLAAQWLKKSEEAVSAEERERTKRIVYASLYGAGARTLADILQVSYERALAVLTSFNRTFPSLKSFGRAVVQRCAAQDGLLRTAGGRARAFPDITSDQPARRAHAERQAVNYVVQGTAADLCKSAMVLTSEALQACEPPVEAHLLLQLHDELVWEVRARDVERAADVIKSAMEACGAQCGVAVALPVAVARGRDWGHMESLAGAPAPE